MSTNTVSYQPPEPAASRTQTHPAAVQETSELEWSLLAYYCSLTVLITLAPFRFHWPSSIQFLWIDGWFDIVCNVLLFLPLGFLYRLTRKSGPGSSAFRAFVIGLCISTGIEITQIFLPGRYPSPADVLTNALGAWLGAWIYDYTQQRLNRHWVGRLGLQLPLMNIVYLLVPLIWLDVLAAGKDPSRSRLAWLLEICGCVVLAGVYRYGMKQPRVLGRKGLILIAMAWFFASSIPAFMDSPSTPILGSLLAGIFVYLLTQLDFGPGEQKRFELPILKRVWPLYAAYLVMLFMWPLTVTLGHWHGAFGFVELTDDPSLVSMLRLMEQFAAFTLLGYIVAESHGRREISQATSVAWTCFWCGLAAAGLELCQGFHPDHSASFAAGLLLFIGSIYGAVIYWRQLSSIQRLFSRARKPRVSRSSEATELARDTAL